jgi:hypothetical protein
MVVAPCSEIEKADTPGGRSAFVSIIATGLQISCRKLGCKYLAVITLSIFSRRVTREEIPAKMPKVNGKKLTVTLGAFANRHFD